MTAACCVLCGKAWDREQRGYKLRNDGGVLCVAHCSVGLESRSGSNNQPLGSAGSNSDGGSSTISHLPAWAPLSGSPCLQRSASVHVGHAARGTYVHETAAAASAAPLKRSAELAGFNALSASTSPAIMPPGRKVALDPEPVPFSFGALSRCTGAAPTPRPAAVQYIAGARYDTPQQSGTVLSWQAARPVSAPVSPAAGTRHSATHTGGFIPGPGYGLPQAQQHWQVNTIYQLQSSKVPVSMPPTSPAMAGCVHKTTVGCAQAQAAPQWQIPAPQYMRSTQPTPATTPGAAPTACAPTPSVADVLGEDWDAASLDDDSKWETYEPPQTTARPGAATYPTTPNENSNAQHAGGHHGLQQSEQPSPSQVLGTLSLRSPGLISPTPIQRRQPATHGLKGSVAQQPHNGAGAVGGGTGGWQDSSSHTSLNVARRLDVDGCEVSHQHQQHQQPPQQPPQQPQPPPLQPPQQMQYGGLSSGAWKHQPEMQPQVPVQAQAPVQQPYQWQPPNWQQQQQQQQQQVHCHVQGQGQVQQTASCPAAGSCFKTPYGCHSRAFSLAAEYQQKWWDRGFWERLVRNWKDVRTLGRTDLDKHARANECAARRGHKNQLLMDEALPKVEAWLGLIFPLRLVVEYLGILQWVSAEALTCLASTSPEKVDALLQSDFAEAQAVAVKCGQGARLTEPGWPMLPSSAMKVMVELGWIIWVPERGQYRYDFSPKQYCVDAAGQVLPSQFVKVCLALCFEGESLTTQIELTGLRQATSTHMSRHPVVNAHDKLLCVTPSEDVPEKALKDCIAHHSTADAQVHTPQGDQGGELVLAGRQYQYLAFKERKLYYIAADTAAAGDLLDDQGFPMPGGMGRGRFVGLKAAHARDMLAAVRTIPYKPSSGKLNARMELLLSHTVPIPGLLSANFRYTDDLYGSGLGDDGKPACMTDGAGLMGLGVARCCPRVSQGELSRQGWLQVGERDTFPIAQVRVVDPRVPLGMLGKGLLVPSSVIPPDMVLMTFSMIKAPIQIKDYIGTLLVEDRAMSQLLGRPVYDVHASVRQAYWDTGPPGVLSGQPQECRACAAIRTAWDRSGRCPDEDALIGHVGVVNSSFGRMGGTTDRGLLFLLVHGGVRRSIFIDQMKSQLKRFEGLQTNPELAWHAARGAGSESVEELLSAGVGFRNVDGVLTFQPDLHLRTALYSLEQQRVKELRRMRLSLDGAFRLLGIPDFTGSIPEGCVVVITDKPQEQRQQVLLYRSPGIHPRDIRKALVVPPPPELKGFHQAGSAKGLCLQYTIIFSTKGPQSLAHLMATGDFDGDLYLVITNTDIVESYRVYEEPGAVHALGPAPAQLQPEPQPLAATLQAAATMQLPGEGQWVVQHRQVVPSGASPARQPPNTADALRLLFTLRPAHAKELYSFYFKCTKVDREMGKANYAWMKWADVHGPACPECLQLTNLYEQLLDAKKTGSNAKVPECLANKPMPRWLTMDVEEVRGQRQLLGKEDGARTAHRERLEGLGQQHELTSGQLSVVSELFELISSPSLPDITDPALLDLDPDLAYMDDVEPADARVARERRMQQLFEHYRSVWRDFHKRNPQVGPSAKSQRRAQERRHAIALDLELRMQREFLCHRYDIKHLFDWHVHRRPYQMSLMTEYMRDASALYRMVYLHAQQQLDSGGTPRLRAVWSIAGDVLAMLKSMKLHEHAYVAGGFSFVKRLPMQCNRDVMALVRRGAHARVQHMDMEQEAAALST